MIGGHRAPSVTVAIGDLAGTAAAGQTRHQGRAQAVATAWIETLHTRAQLRAERHLGSRRPE